MAVSDNDLREEVLRKFSTDRLNQELQRRGINFSIIDQEEETIKKLTETNRKVFFERNNFKKGDIFTYSPAFDLNMVRSLAIRNGWFIRYCSPGEPEYKVHGCFCCEIVQELSYADARAICDIMPYLT